MKNITFTGTRQGPGKKSRHFPDRNGRAQARSAKGNYGHDVTEGNNQYSAAYQSTYPIKLGRYKLGEFSFSLGWDGFEFGFSSREPKIYRKTINKSLSEAIDYLGGEKGSSREIADHFNTTLRNYLPSQIIKDVKVKEIIVEGPNCAASVGLSARSFGASGYVQRGSIALVVETPYGDLTARFRTGQGAGLTLKRAKTKKGKPGKEREVSFALGEFEIEFAKTSQSTTELEGNQAQGGIRIENLREEAQAVNEKMNRNHIETASQGAAAGAGAGTNEVEAEVDQSALLDALAAQVQEHFSNDSQIQQYYNEYVASAEKESLFARYKKFKQKTTKHLEREKKLDQLAECGMKASMLCSEVAKLTNNKTAARFATGVSALTQAFTGIRELSNNFSLITSISSISGCMSGAGLVLGAFTMLSGLMEEDGPDPIEEALAQIHATIMDMWQDMQEQFDHVFERLDQIEDTLEEMEGNAELRFNILLSTIHHYGTEIQNQIDRSEVTIRGELNYMNTSLVSYLEHLVDTDARRIIDRASKEDDLTVSDKLSEYSASLSEWLTATAAISSRSGHIPREHNRLGVEPNILPRILSSALAPEQLERHSIKLGLIASLAQDLDETIFANDAAISRIINPEDWSYMLGCYLQVTERASDTILFASSRTQESYNAQIQRVKKVPQTVLRLLSNLSESTQVKTTLVSRYIRAWDKLKEGIETILENKRKAVNIKAHLPEGERLFALEQSAHTASERLATTPEHQQRVYDLIEREKYPSPIAAGAGGAAGGASSQMHQLTASHSTILSDPSCFQPGERLQTQRAPAEKPMAITSTQYEGLFLKGENLGVLPRVYNHRNFVLAALYLSPPTFFIHYCGVTLDKENVELKNNTYNSRGLKIRTSNTGVYYVTGFRINDIDCPMTQGRFRCDEPDMKRHEWEHSQILSTETLGKNYHVIGFHEWDKYNCIRSDADGRFLQHPKFNETIETLENMDNVFEERLLKPARKEAAESMLRDFDALIQDILIAARTMQLFIRLLNPNAQIDVDLVEKRLRTLVEKLEREQTADAVQALLDANLVELFRESIGIDIEAPGPDEQQANAGAGEQEQPEQGPREQPLHTALNMTMNAEPLTSLALWQEMRTAITRLDALAMQIDPEDNLEPLLTRASHAEQQQRQVSDRVTQLDNRCAVMRELMNEGVLEEETLRPFFQQRDRIKGISKDAQQEMRLIRHAVERQAGAGGIARVFSNPTAEETSTTHEQRSPTPVGAEESKNPH